MTKEELMEKAREMVIHACLLNDEASEMALFDMLEENGLLRNRALLVAYVHQSRHVRGEFYIDTKQANHALSMINVWANNGTVVGDDR